MISLSKTNYIYVFLFIIIGIILKQLLYKDISNQIITLFFKNLWFLYDLTLFLKNFFALFS